MGGAPKSYPQPHESANHHLHEPREPPDGEIIQYWAAMGGTRTYGHVAASIYRHHRNNYAINILLGS